MTSAGWQAGLILRQGNAPLGIGPQPDYIGKNLDEIADQLIDKYHPSRVVTAPAVRRRQKLPKDRCTN